MPTPNTYQAFGWSVRASVSSEDGLVVENVTLGQRLMAQKISIPYLQLKTSKFDKRMELRPNTTITDLARGRLIGFWVADEVGLVGANGTNIPRRVIEAVYRLDRFANGSTSVLFVRQRYEFFQATSQEQYPELACEPSNDTIAAPFEEFTCARWKPIYSYNFLARGGETLTSIKMPERLHLTPDGQPLRGNAVLHDCEDNETGTTMEPCLFTQAIPPLVARQGSIEG